MDSLVQRDSCVVTAASELTTASHYLVIPILFIFNAGTVFYKYSSSAEVCLLDSVHS